jgi:cytochrome c oxidase subunit 3
MEIAITEQVSRERELNSLATVTLIVTLVAVTMTFGALIVVFLMRSVSGEFWTHIHLPDILWVSCALLVASSFLFERGRKKLVSHDTPGFHALTRWTVLLGLAFLACQIAAGYQILHSGVILRNNPHSWFMFIFGGLHALHIIAGLSGFVVLYRRTRERATGPRYQMVTRVTARAVGLFWHYMDGMWLVLFALLLFWHR